MRLQKVEPTSFAGGKNGHTLIPPMLGRRVRSRRRWESTTGKFSHNRGNLWSMETSRSDCVQCAWGIRHRNSPAGPSPIMLVAFPNNGTVLFFERTVHQTCLMTSEMIESRNPGQRLAYDPRSYQSDSKSASRRELELNVVNDRLKRFCGSRMHHWSQTEAH